MLQCCKKSREGGGVLVIDEQREFDSAEIYTRIVQNTCLPRDISTQLLHVNFGYISSSAVKYNILQVLRKNWIISIDCINYFVYLCVYIKIIICSSINLHRTFFWKPSAFIKFGFLDSFLNKIMIYAVNPILK